MRARLELAVLAVVALAITAFALSFAFGLRAPAAESAGPTGAGVARAPVPDAGIAAGRVEVLNASRRAGVARHATDRLRSGGFDVVYFGNAPAAAGDSSIVIDRTGHIDIARAVAARLGITRTSSEPDSTLHLDATVILGVDYAAGENAATVRNGGNDSGGWQDRLRRMLRRER